MVGGMDRWMEGWLGGWMAFAQHTMPLALLQMPIYCWTDRLGPKRKGISLPLSHEPSA